MHYEIGVSRGGEITSEAESDAEPENPTKVRVSSKAKSPNRKGTKVVTAVEASKEESKEESKKESKSNKIRVSKVVSGRVSKAAGHSNLDDGTDDFTISVDNGTEYLRSNLDS